MAIYRLRLQRWIREAEDATIDPHACRPNTCLGERHHGITLSALEKTASRNLGEQISGLNHPHLTFGFTRPSTPANR